MVVKSDLWTSGIEALVEECPCFVFVSCFCMCFFIVISSCEAQCVWLKVVVCSRGKGGGVLETTASFGVMREKAKRTYKSNVFFPPVLSIVIILETCWKGCYVVFQFLLFLFIEFVDFTLVNVDGMRVDWCCISFSQRTKSFLCCVRLFFYWLGD